MQRLLEKLNIDETMTKPVRRPNVWTKVKDNIPHLANYNYMGDLLFLPEDKNKYKYCFVVVDLATNYFDMEPLKNKEPGTVLKALQGMFKRKYIKKPYASIRTDSGSEFLGVFHKWMYSNDILHRIAKAGRHKQLANVESLNKQLGRLFNGYMNNKSEILGSDYTEWTEAIDMIRTDLNKIRYMKPSDPVKDNYPVPDSTVPNKYNVGDIVYVKLDEPHSILGHKESGRFRMGDLRWDKLPRKITKVLYFSGKVPYRYLVSGIDNASFDEYELKKAKEEIEKYIVKEIIGKKIMSRRIHYLVWWKGKLKKDASYEPRSELIKDVPDLIAQYDRNNK